MLCRIFLIGNPMYADKLRFNSVSANGKSDTELYEYAYDDGKQKDEQVNICLFYFSFLLRRRGGSIKGGGRKRYQG